MPVEGVGGGMAYLPGTDLVCTPPKVYKSLVTHSTGPMVDIQ